MAATEKPSKLNITLKRLQISDFDEICIKTYVYLIALAIEIKIMGVQLPVLDVFKMKGK